MTDAGDGAPQIPGVTTEYLSNGVIEEAAPGHVLELVRVTLAPGAEVPEVRHPGGALIYVERGAIRVTTGSGTTELLAFQGRSALLAPSADCGEGCNVAQGESIVLSAAPAFAVANTGDGEAVLHVSALTQRGSRPTAWSCDRACRTMAQS